MSLTVPQYIFAVTMWTGLGYIVIWPVFFAVVAWLMPKRVLHDYFREPHFSRSEQWMFTATPFSYMRTLSMIGPIAFPRLGRKRGITDIREHCPTWYVRLTQAFLYWFFGCGGLFAVVMLGLGIYYA